MSDNLSCDVCVTLFTASSTSKGGVSALTMILAPLRFPFSAGVQFSLESFPAFNDRSNIGGNGGLELFVSTRVCPGRVSLSHVYFARVSSQGPVVQNRYPVDKCWQNKLFCPLESDLSGHPLNNCGLVFCNMYSSSAHVSRVDLTFSEENVPFSV